jgi:hypothetical protein
LKKLFKNRKACAEALLNELQQKFPKADFRMTYYGEWELNADTCETLRYEAGLTKAQAKRSMKLYWDDGPSIRTVDDIASKYEKETLLFLDNGVKRVDNIGFDEDGEPVLMGSLYMILTNRSMSDEGFDKAEAMMAESADENADELMIWEEIDL